jgi:maltose O-acetyltransferase
MRRLISLFKRLRRALFGWDQGAELRKMGMIAGEGLNIQSDVIIDPNHCWHVELGDRVKFAPRVYLLCHDSSMKKKFGYTRVSRIKIGSRVFVGAGTIVCPGATIGDDCVIGAGSIVFGDIPSGSLAVGNPAKVIMPVEEFYARKRAEFEECPKFGHEYTVNGGITDEMKKEMNEKMVNGVLYVK